MAGLTPADEAEISAYEVHASPEEVARYRAELYRLRNTPSTGFLAGYPKWVLLLIALWFGALETADKLPTLMLSYPRYQAALAEAEAKLIQPDLMQAQLTKAQNEAAASKLQPDMVQAQLTKAKAEALASVVQPDMATAQLTKAKAEALASVVQPEMAAAQLAKAENDAKTSAIQPDLTDAQLLNARLEAKYRAMQPQLTQMQIVKLGLDTQVVMATLPNTQAGAVLAGQMIKIMQPWTELLGRMITPQSAAARQGATATITASNLNIRTEPQLTAKVRATIPYGGTVTIIRMLDGEWAEVEVKDGAGTMHGFASSKYLSTTQ